MRFQLHFTLCCAKPLIAFCSAKEATASVPDLLPFSQMPKLDIVYRPSMFQMLKKTIASMDAAVSNIANTRETASTPVFCFTNYIKQLSCIR